MLIFSSAVSSASSSLSFRLAARAHVSSSVFLAGLKSRGLFEAAQLLHHVAENAGFLREQRIGVLARRHVGEQQRRQIALYFGVADVCFGDAGVAQHRKHDLVFDVAIAQPCATEFTQLRVGLLVNMTGLVFGILGAAIGAAVAMSFVFSKGLRDLLREQANLPPLALENVEAVLLLLGLCIRLCRRRRRIVFRASLGRLFRCHWRFRMVGAVPRDARVHDQLGTSARCSTSRAASCRPEC
jgi:hypothetical protein